jgi:methionyl aminopeptidase
VNYEVVHGIPSPARRLAEGDIVSVDCGVKQNGFFADAAVTLPVGAISAGARELLEITQQALRAGIAEARSGQRLGDVGAAIQAEAEKAGYGIVRDLVGHGIGRQPHEDPQVPNYGQRGKGELLRTGMVLAIEPMLNAGTARVRTLPDRWTVVTADRSLSAHFEHTVAITAAGPRILTRTPEAASLPIRGVA